MSLLGQDSRKVVGCVLFYPNSKGSGRLFQMAVEPTRQRRGIGRRLVRHLEQHLLRQCNITSITLHARKYAIRFYEKLGYKVYGDAFEELGIEVPLL